MSPSLGGAGLDAALTQGRPGLVTCVHRLPLLLIRTRDLVNRCGSDGIGCVVWCYLAVLRLAHVVSLFRWLSASLCKAAWAG